MTERPVTLDTTTWVVPVHAETCPLLPHTQALGEKPRPCMIVAAAKLNTTIVQQCEHCGELLDDPLRVQCRRDA